MKEKIKDNLKYILMIIILVIISIIIIAFYTRDEKEKDVIKDNKNILEKNEKTKEEKEEVLFYVDIKGEVNNPGVYKLKENSRVIDVINQAGGLKENADTSIINLSKKIFDEMFIIIYSKDEINKYKEKNISTKIINDNLDKNLLIIDENNDANIKTKSKKTTSNIKQQNEENKLVNINLATKEELLTITGIGESKADAIINYREENGEFESIEDIKNVSGIGDSLFDKIKEYITV